MTAAPSITAGSRLVTYPFRPASCRARSMVFWFSSQVAPVTFRNRVRVTGDLPAAAFSARAICGDRLVVPLAALERPLAGHPPLPLVLPRPHDTGGLQDLPAGEVVPVPGEVLGQVVRCLGDP